jgi:short-subunit dehydrogenase
MNSSDEFEEAYRVNVFAMFRLCKAILPQMEAGGCIINTGSIQSFDPSPSLLPYASTKAAIVSFTGLSPVSPSSVEYESTP